MKTPLSPPDAALRRFRIVHAVYLSAFAVVMLSAKGIMPRIPFDWGRWLFAFLPIALLALWAWEFARMIRAADERQQPLHLRALAFSCGSVLLAASLWDVVARELGGSGPPVFLLLPASALIYGITHARLAPGE